MTFDRRIYTWPRVGAIYDDGAVELNVHCLHKPNGKILFVGFVGMDREEQIDRIEELTEQTDCTAQMIDGSGFTDAIVRGLLASMIETLDTPGASMGLLEVEWVDE